MMCSFCNTETDAEKVDKTAGSYICSHCFQLLLNETQENLSKAYALAIAKGYHDKAKAIQSFLEEKINDRKTENTERDMVRKRLSRSARPSLNRVRT
jgi:pyrrolidone-carboxylate peptidase